MRRLFTLLFLSACFVASGQDYHKLVVEGNSWSVVNWSWGWAWTDYYFLDGDTLINDTSYMKLYVSSDSSLQTDVSYFCGLREDTSAREVYFHYNYFWGDRLLYKFGLDVGDSVTVTSLACEEILMIVSNVDTITDLLGFERQRMIMLPSFDGFDEYWIDGIGSTLGLLTAGNIYCVADFNQDLLCFKQSYDLSYMNPLFTKCHIGQVSINEHKILNEEIKVYPNPVIETSDIIINNDLKVKSYTLYNSSGILISELTSPKIEKGNLKPGIYFLVIETAEGDILTSSFILQ